MKTVVVVITVVVSIIFVWLLFAWGVTATYDPNVSTESIRNVISREGLEICTEEDLSLSQTPGFMEGKTVTVSVNCGLDDNPMRVSILGFDSIMSRDAAMQRIQSTHRNGFGPSFAYVYGPYVITLEGTRGIAEQAILGRILNRAGATP